MKYDKENLKTVKDLMNKNSRETNKEAAQLMKKVLSDLEEDHDKLYDFLMPVNERLMIRVQRETKITKTQIIELRESIDSISAELGVTYASYVAQLPSDVHNLFPKKKIQPEWYTKNIDKVIKLMKVIEPKLKILLK